MEKLKLKLRKNGFDYFQITRDDNFAIYLQVVSDEIFRYEVFKIKTVQESILRATVYPARELFPGNEDFGSTAWTCMTIDLALKKYHDLIEKHFVKITMEK